MTRKPKSPSAPQRFAPREQVAAAAKTAPRVDADQFRRDVDSVSASEVPSMARAFHLLAEMPDDFFADGRLDFFPRQAALEVQAVRGILRGTRWLTAAEVPHGSSWKQHGRIFALAIAGEERYPSYAVGPDLKPLPVVREVLDVFAGYGPELIAAWFESTSRFLSGKRPRELVATDPPAVLAAARYEVETRENQG